ncbi:MAG: hypothetical protein K0B81_02275 [Candidatus Cloacimonetes bacterium]|nr:hypothetical protein [Candidatus Cloacimonadota bacterium]
MKKTIFLMILLLGLSFLMAHPPTEMNITFNEEELLLTIVIEHNVNNPGNHYIDQLTIQHGRNELVVHKMSRQDDNDSVTLVYRLPDVQSGMKLNIVASCNRIGRLTREFEIE